VTPDPAESESDDAWWADHTRIVALPMPSPTLPPPPRPPQPRPAPPLPQPGRHAAARRIGSRRSAPRRVGAWHAELLARVPVLGAAHLTVVALVVALGLAVTTWWVVRDRTTQLAPVSAQPTGPLVLGAAGPAATPNVPAAPSASAAAAEPAAQPVTAGPASATPVTSVTVDVTGKVRRPGIVVLAQGARVTDALRAAGGARRGVSLRSLNLARVLVDGEQIVVGGPPGPLPAAPQQAAGAPAALVNLNTADQTLLETLPQVGPVTAQAIVAWRTEHGGFSSVDELLEVDGIGPKTLDRLLAYVTV
jgi:competence protein ComEA